ncbi:Sec-independent protein translocase protein TatB [Roseococcus sp. SDR]|uniref:Sec-independent protein translocase protein TatB n=1 Tax=Roseococcus sp. SDR TaxID=2835532 RepID=UPI001BD073EB|nr:Sec-independent protein translocase protein TatB [Roseococcus sp. SDR]MBS7792500.1 Sec-independent protein translocase protein TatB [Roseococcus sp. SDR]MBV1847814.1 Sec-independent protein translocase protein TatB [Roseococcus sp. SDR]
MLDLAWSEILLIAVVALVVIGPKDLPGAIRGIADLIKTGKKKLASFQQQADELVREAKLDEVRNQIAEVKGAINEIRSFDLKGEITKTVDADGTLTKTFSENPLGGSSTPAWTPPPTARDTPDAPAMIPPQTMAPYKAPDPVPPPPAPDMPSFVPPSTPAPLNVAPPPAPAPVTPPAPTTATPDTPAAEAAAKTA